jgi:hypothetical protein
MQSEAHLYNRAMVTMPDRRQVIEERKFGSGSLIFTAFAVGCVLIAESVRAKVGNPHNVRPAVFMVGTWGFASVAATASFAWSTLVLIAAWKPHRKSARLALWGLSWIVSWGLLTVCLRPLF